MQLMIANKRLRYGGVTLDPGEQFYVGRSSHVKYLKNTGKAKEGRLDFEPEPEPETKPKPEFQLSDERTALRQEYERIYGRKPWSRWDDDTLREKINSYQRRDMRAE